MTATETVAAPEKTASPMLSLDAVARTFADGTGLNPVTIDVARGEFITVLGPSGCGKSTLLRCVAGLEIPTSGVMHLAGRKVFDAGSDGARAVNVPPARRSLSMVFQDLALWPHMTVAGNVEFPLTARGEKIPASERRRRVGEALEMVGISAKAGQRPHQLSGGQQQRVAIARAVVDRPDLLLMDEPLSALDAALRVQVRREITDLARELGLTVLYVTHDQEEALSLADRLVVLRAGRVQQIGTPQELHDNPANWHVADFMGYRNLLEATVSADADGQGRVRIRADDLELVGTAVNPTAAGETVRLAVRPTDLVVQASQSAAASPVNTIAADVEIVEYQGRDYAVEVRTTGGRTLHVRSDHAPEVGTKVLLTVDPSRALVYQEDLDTATTVAHDTAVPA